MDKEMVDEFCREESTEWSFPDLELFIKADYETIYNDDAVQSSDPEKDKNNLLADLINENEKLKSDYQKKNALLDTLITQFKNPIALLDKDMMELVQYVIKSAVKKIIYKEIKSDTKLINKIVTELTALLDSHHGMVTVMLSEEDYNRLMTDYDKSMMILKINPALNEGDVIIKSNFTEIHAILNDRINQVLGTKNA